MTQQIRLGIIAAIFLALAYVALSLTLTGPTWSPTTPFTNDTLLCTWTNSTDTLAQNITLLRNGAYFNSTFENASLQDLSNTLALSAANTTRGERWTCRVTLYNATAASAAEINVTILNSPPTTEGSGAGIFNISNTDVGYLVRVAEDTTVSIDVNATDADGDSLTYLPGDGFCARTSSTLGTYTCSPTQSDVTNNSPTSTNITFTVSDGQNVGGRTITFNVTPVNDAPTTSLTAQNTSVNQSLNYTFTVSDEETNTPYTFTISADAEISNKLSVTRLNANGSQASFYYDGSSPDFSDIGLWNITLNITDNSTSYSGSSNNATSTYTFTLNITPVGRRPYFTNITPNGTYGASQGSLVQINISANDPDANSTIVFLDDTARFAISTVKGNTNASDARAQINFTPTNDDVGTYNVTITIVDGTTLSNTTVLSFNISNVNDAPSLHEISASPSNSLGNTNASNLSAYTNSPFIYSLNATDPDTIHGDTLTFSSNASIFTINATTGRINFTPTAGQMGIHTINATVSDASGVNASRLINITISANVAPYFNATLTQLNCTTNASCMFAAGLYAADDDIGDNITSFTMSLISGTLGSFAYNNATGLINFTTAKTDVGNYTINITIFDRFGASNSSQLNLSINNTPDAPQLVRYNFTGSTLVETHLFTYELQATDADFYLSVDENVTFDANLTFNYTITPLSTSNVTARALLSFTPPAGSNGTYTVRINATDTFGLSASQNITMVILPLVPPPNITNITPWGNGTNSSIQTSFASTSLFSNNLATVNLSENTTVLFNVTATSSLPLSYAWSVNGTQVSTSSSYSRAFDFFSAGSYNVTLNVSHARLEYSLWTWDVHVNDQNRLPRLASNLTSPLSVNGTVSYSEYFVLSNGTKFIDPDDDLDSSGVLNGNETNSMTFSANSTCSVATLSISGATLTVQGTSVGECSVAFIATDSAGATLTSNVVNISITDVVTGTTETVTTTSSSSGGGGGGSSSSSTIVPLRKTQDSPVAFHLIAPRLVTIYENRSVVIPVIINNTWNGPLQGLRLTAESNVTAVRMSFDTNYFAEIPVNETREVMLTIDNYRFGDNFEIVVRGNVTSPAYSDEAMILLNSIEAATDGESAHVKVTFANDLVNEHPECQELNEVLIKAKQLISEGKTEEGTSLVDSVISGCRYLVSTQQKVQEKPSRINPIIIIDSLSLRIVLLGVVALVILSSIAFMIYYHYTHKPEDDI
jgi:hypothetical protein